MSTSPRTLALGFLDAFVAGDLDRLGALLAEDLRFRGPLLCTDSRAAYLEALAHDPPRDGAAEVLHASQDDSNAALIYHYTTPDASTLIAQLTQCRDERIEAITLIFDPSAFRGGRPPTARPTQGMG